jgi:phosphoribosyl 1,2-cyclic phosphodiesterase
MYVKLKFLGTRGYIDARTRRHRRHSSLMVSYYNARIMIDCGADWKGRLNSIRPHAVVVTHGHPDHVGGLLDEVPCPVYATGDTWKKLSGMQIEQREQVVERRPFHIRRIRFEAFAVAHSTRAPAVGYRITAGRACVFYAPDLIYIKERKKALGGTNIYIGDGATLVRSFVRKRGDALIGHTPVRTQLTWCAKEGVPRAIITHCGSEIVSGDERRLGARLRAMARERGIRAEFAHDGMAVVLR